MCDEICGQPVESLRLPKGRHSPVRNAVLNVIGILRIAMLTGRKALITNRKAKDAGSTSWNPKLPCSVRNCGSIVTG